MSGKTAPTVESIVEQLGGRNAVAELCNVTYNAVSNWCAWDAFPRRVHLEISRACREKKIDVPESLFDTAAKRRARSAA